MGRTQRPAQQLGTQGGHLGTPTSCAGLQLNSDESSRQVVLEKLALSLHEPGRVMRCWACLVWPCGTVCNRQLCCCCFCPRMTTRVVGQACFVTLRSTLSQASLEVFGLGQAADLNPLLPDGLLGQLLASNLLGALQVVMEDVVAEIQQLKQEQPDAATRVSARQAAPPGKQLCSSCCCCCCLPSGSRCHWWLQNAQV